MPAEVIPLNQLEPVQTFLLMQKHIFDITGNT